jgi:hypothetical protein
MEPNINILYSSAFCIFDQKFGDKCYYLAFRHNRNLAEEIKQNNSKIRQIAEQAVDEFLNENPRPDGINWSEVWDEVPRKYWKRHGIDLIQVAWIESIDPIKIEEGIRKLGSPSVNYTLFSEKAFTS